MIRLKSYKLFLGWLLLPLLLTACPNPAPPDFQISVSPVAIQVHQGESVEATLRVIPKNGFKGTLTLSYQKSGGGGLPSGLSVAPDSATVSGSAVDVTLTVTASDSAELGKHDLEVTATQGKLRHKASFSVTVVPPAGTLDATFGTDGVVTFDGGDDELGYSLAFGDGGAIYVLGRDGKYLWVRKYDGDGNPVSGFGSSGVLRFLPVRSLSSAERDNDLDHALIPLPGGDFLAGGYAYNSTRGDDDLLLAKFDASGTLDSDFGSGGIQTYNNLLYPPGSGNANEQAHSLALGSDGRIWVAGFAYQDTDKKEQLLAMKVNLASPGSPKKAGSGGDGTDYAYTLGMLSDGAFLAGSSNEGGGFKGVWLRLNADLSERDSGALSSFDGGRVAASALDAEGRVVLAGYTYDGTDTDVVVVRMSPDGVLDPSFGSSGVVRLDALGGLSDWGDYAFSVALDGEGRILVAGRSVATHDGSRRDYDLVVLRLRPDGSLDPSFGDGGVFLWDGGHGDDGAFEVALDGQGRIVVTGFSDNGSDYDLVLLRLNP